MWARLDDELIDHQKVWAAGKRLGANGPAIALGLYAVSLMWTNKHLTDGFLPIATIEGFRHVQHPRVVADALAHAGLFTKVKGGFEIHDFAEYNPTGSAIKAKRKKDRIRKQHERATINGHA